MGSHRSGNRRATRSLVEDALHVPIGWMVTRCPIRVGHWLRSFVWKQGSQPYGSLSFILSRTQEAVTRIVLVGRKNGVEFRQIVKIANVPMPKGGLKSYALCPYCHKRCLRLYFTRLPLAACRQCSDLTYRSSRDSSPLGRLFNYFDRLDEELIEIKLRRAQEKHLERCRTYRQRQRAA